MAGFLGEVLNSGFNATDFNWRSSSTAMELETLVMDWLAKLLSSSSGAPPPSRRPTLATPPSSIRRRWPQQAPNRTPTLPDSDTHQPPQDHLWNYSITG
ncbi:hypothetical protein J5N97_028084 [Dioscorea zingiberensis]|uniref:Uncharacterized protein n=1 Tax=Dioscorea zingiberensis TaxID=325984 RepID=A0A9D5BXW2_9LILI|nr:hypothetical protein J5N97_028084 [Dioscorea zingiberensis]